MYKSIIEEQNRLAKKRMEHDLFVDSFEKMLKEMVNVTEKRILNEIDKKIKQIKELDYEKLEKTDNQMYHYYNGQLDALEKIRDKINV